MAKTKKPPIPADPTPAITETPVTPPEGGNSPGEGSGPGPLGANEPAPTDSLIAGIDDPHKPNESPQGASVVYHRPTETTTDPAPALAPIADGAPSDQAPVDSQPLAPEASGVGTSIDKDEFTMQSTNAIRLDSNQLDDPTFRAWVDAIAEVKPFVPSEGAEPIDMYVTRFDGTYLGFGLDDFTWLFGFGITEQLQGKAADSTVATIGFNPTEQKWYGWSHRAAFGFGIGHTVEPGQAGFVPSNPAEFLAERKAWYADENHVNVMAFGPVKVGQQTGVVTTWHNSDTIGNEALRGQPEQRFDPYPETWGKGVWTAQTLDDAKQMAIDFANSVS